MQRTLALTKHIIQRVAYHCTVNREKERKKENGGGGGARKGPVITQITFLDAFTYLEI